MQNFSKEIALISASKESRLTLIKLLLEDNEKNSFAMLNQRGTSQFSFEAARYVVLLNLLETSYTPYIALLLTALSLIKTSVEVQLVRASLEQNLLGEALAANLSEDKCQDLIKQLEKKNGNRNEPVRNHVLYGLAAFVLIDNVLLGLRGNLENFPALFSLIGPTFIQTLLAPIRWLWNYSSSALDTIKKELKSLSTHCSLSIKEVNCIDVSNDFLLCKPLSSVDFKSETDYVVVTITCQSVDAAKQVAFSLDRLFAKHNLLCQVNCILDDCVIFCIPGSDAIKYNKQIVKLDSITEILKSGGLCLYKAKELSQSLSLVSIQTELAVQLDFNCNDKPLRVQFSDPNNLPKELAEYKNGQIEFTVESIDAFIMALHEVKFQQMKSKSKLLDDVIDYKMKVGKEHHILLTLTLPENYSKKEEIRKLFSTRLWPFLRLQRHSLRLASPA